MAINITEEYKLSKYEDYGKMSGKEHIHLVRNRQNGKICVKKEMDVAQKEVLEFRAKNPCRFYPELYDVIEMGGNLIVIEEYIEGVNLSEYMMEEPLEEKQAIDFARQICQGLLPLHHAEPMIVYRDLKADNIMITKDGAVKLIDFNISRKVQEGKNRDTVLLGTAEYAAPEQFGYFQTDNRTDIYSFGVLLNYMLTVKFPADEIAEGKCAKIIKKCIEMEPSKRYQQVEEILAELQGESLSECDKNILKESLEPEKISLKQKWWPIPGFRTKKWWKILIAVAGYWYLIAMGFTTEFLKDDGTLQPPLILWLSRAVMTGALIGCVFYACNYLGIAEKYPVFKKKFKGKRILEIMIAGFVLLVVGACGVAMIETIMGL